MKRKEKEKLRLESRDQQENLTIFQSKISQINSNQVSTEVSFYFCYYIIFRGIQVSNLTFDGE